MQAMIHARKVDLGVGISPASDGFRRLQGAAFHNRIGLAGYIPVARGLARIGPVSDIAVADMLFGGKPLPSEFLPKETGQGFESLQPVFFQYQHVRRFADLDPAFVRRLPDLSEVSLGQR